MFMAERIMPLKLWHKWFRHLNLQSLWLLSKYGAMHGIPKFSTSIQNEVCGGYMIGKQTKEKSPKFVATQMTIHNAHSFILFVNHYHIQFCAVLDIS
jgi:hypothetical protein